MHSIRLREPWNVETKPGVVCYRRAFNKPTGLDEQSVVRLAVDGLAQEARVFLNDRELTNAAGVLSDQSIVGQLQLRNWIAVEVPALVEPVERPFLEVRLEIG